MTFVPDLSVRERLELLSACTLLGFRRPDKAYWNLHGLDLFCRF